LAEKDATVWTADHPNIEAVSLGPNPIMTGETQKLFHELLTNDKDFDFFRSAVEMFSNSMKHYPKQYNYFYNWLTTNKVDVIICDFFMDGCYDAAYETNTPFAITISTFDYKG
jgi:uncharacterized protein (DUF2252 family)